ncbi:MAG TPA: sensor histidine kinase, partial [Nannocystaceae bacterium]|nr:sensor histidine kinase [Nannocystaceae bacterium]
SNAIKFTPPGGNVQLRAGVYGGGARISVHDSGPGIPAAERAAVLERFYRSETTRQLPGSGLGLSIGSAIVRLHGFELDIGTAAEGGACVILDCGPPTLGEER